MTEYYKLDNDLIVNTVDSHYTIKAGQYVVKEATALLTGCDEKQLPTVRQRVDADVVQRDFAIAEAVRIEAERIEAEELLKETEAPIEDGGV